MTDERPTGAREAYLRNQQAVAASKPADHRWNPWRVAAIAGAMLSGALFVVTVVSYYNDPQQEGPVNVVLPTATSFAFLMTLFLLVLPYLIESPAIAARVRNVLVGATIAFILSLLCVGVFVGLCSLVADLAYNLTH